MNRSTTPSPLSRAVTAPPERESDLSEGALLATLPPARPNPLLICLPACLPAHRPAPKPLPPHLCQPPDQTSTRLPACLPACPSAFPAASCPPPPLVPFHRPFLICVHTRLVRYSHNIAEYTWQMLKQTYSTGVPCAHIYICKSTCIYVCVCACACERVDVYMRALLTRANSHICVGSTLQSNRNTIYGKQ